jgi:hypothetical protein
MSLTQITNWIIYLKTNYTVEEKVIQDWERMARSLVNDPAFRTFRTFIPKLKQAITATYFVEESFLKEAVDKYFESISHGNGLNWNWSYNYEDFLFCSKCAPHYVKALQESTIISVDESDLCLHDLRSAGRIQLTAKSLGNKEWKLTNESRKKLLRLIIK